MNPKIGKTLNEKYGVNMPEVVYPEEATQTEGGNLAANILYSLGKFVAPLVAILKGDQVCELDNSLKERSCAKFKTMPA